MPRHAALTALFLLGFLTTLAGNGRAEGIDCADTELDLPLDHFVVTCLAESGVARTSENFGKADYEVLAARDVAGGVEVIAISMRMNASRSGFERNDVKSSLTTLFSKIAVADFKPADDRQGFDIAEFTSEGKKCVGFQRYFNKTYSIYKRAVIGYICAAGNQADAYAALDALKAPGQ